MWKILLSNYRQFHNSSHLDTKIGRVMKKVMGQTSKRKRIFTETGILPTAEMFTKGSIEGKHSKSARRVSVLNKLFMKYITDLLATGEHAAEFTGRGIEINRVQISPDYTGLNVFWVAKQSEVDDDNIETVLKKNAGFLRHELSSLRVIGNVPRINFVKDKQFSQIVELDSRLSKADFGDDHKPIEIATKIKTQLELFTNLSADIKEKVQELESEGVDNIEEKLPEMPQNVLGLDHSEIMKKIKRNLKKSKALHRKEENDPDLIQSFNENPIDFGSHKERREAFKKFLQDRETMKSKLRKLDKNYYPDLEYMKQEFEDRQAEYFKNMEAFEEEQDYLEDDDKYK